VLIFVGLHYLINWLIYC